MTNSKEQSLVDALSYACVRSLPDEWDGTSEFTDAIALVKKGDNNEYYCIAKQKNGGVVIVKDFGPISFIREIISVHPYCLSEGEHSEGLFDINLPKFRNKSERLVFIAEKHIETLGDPRSMKVSEIDDIIIDWCKENGYNG